MNTHGPNPTHWNDGTPMTERERKRRAGFLAHQKKKKMQGAADPEPEIIMCDAVVEEKTHELRP